MISNGISGLIVIFVFDLLSIIASLYNILIGKNIIKNPMYDSEEKRKYIFKIGLICIIPLSFFAIFLFYIIFIIFQG